MFLVLFTSILAFNFFMLVSPLVIGGINIPHAKTSAMSKIYDNWAFPTTFPYSQFDLTPEDSSNDQLFYIIPKFMHHAGDECRAALTEYYDCVLPRNKDQSVLDLCSSFTSHYPTSWHACRCVALGLNPLELAANPSKTEFLVQNLNRNPKFSFSDNEFDLITNSLSVDYLTKPLEVFAEMYRVLKPGGLAAMAFTNRCFPTKIVPIWANPFTDLNHCKIVGTYFKFSADWKDINVVDVSPAGRIGQQDPMFIVQARK